MAHNSDSASTLYLTSKRARNVGSNIHLVAGVGILFTGLNNFDFPDHRTLAIVEIVIGVLLLLAIVLEKLLPRARSEKYDWILDVLAGGVAFVEGLSKMHGEFRPIVATYWLAALMFLALAYFRPRLKKMRYARFEKDNLVLKLHPFKPKHVIGWNDVASIVVNGNVIITTKAESVFKIDLNDQEQPAEVKDAFLEQVRVRTIGKEKKS